jgi:adenine-specific DNA-methyltransferase
MVVLLHKFHYLALCLARAKDENGFYITSIDEKTGWIKTLPQESNGIKTVWRWGKKKAEVNITNIIAKKHRDGFFQVYKKYREDTFVYNSVWSDNEIKTDKGTLQIKELFDNVKVFDYVKPLGLLDRIISIFTEENDLILDFFSGSSTTGHAIMLDCEKSKFNKNFILVQMPEIVKKDSEAYRVGYKTIAEIGKERIRRAAKKIKKNNPETKADLGFKVFKLVNSNYKDKDWKDYHGNDQDQLNTLLQDNLSPLKDGWQVDDVISEIILFEGFPLTSHIKTLQDTKENFVYEVSSDDCGHKLLICLDEKITDEVVKKLPLNEIDVFILRPEKYEEEKWKPKNMFDVLTRTIDLMEKEISISDVVIAKLQAKEKNVKLNFYYTPYKLTDNSLIFNKEQMEKWWKEGYEYVKENGPTKQITLKKQ